MGGEAQPSLPESSTTAHDETPPVQRDETPPVQ
jgi:hypothetical protein